MPSIMIPVMMDEPEVKPTLYVVGVVGKVGIGAMYVPLASIMATAPVTVSIKMAHMLTDGDVIWQIRSGAELTQPSWDVIQGSGSMTDNESVQMMGGRILAAGLCATTTNAGANTRIMDDDVVEGFELLPDVPLTLCARRVNGTGGIVSASIAWCEYV